jgi:hypothetical protein
MRWYAYVTGELDDSGILPEGGVVLHILNVWDGTIRDVIQLIPDDYYIRQGEMVKRFLDEEISRTGINREDLEDIIDIWAALLPINDSLRILSWSPDGRYLAFVAMIDGISTDVYLYDLDTGAIQRKDTEYLNLGYISWSPDGQWILYHNMLPYWSNPYFSSPLRSVDIDSNTNINLTSTCGKINWLSNIEFISTPCNKGDGASYDSYSLFRINITTGKKKEIWGGPVYSYAVDKENKQVIISTDILCGADDCSSGDAGLFIGPIFGNIQHVSNDISFHLDFRGGSTHRFLDLSGDSEDCFSIVNGITKEGKLEQLKNGINMQVSHSPDFRWLVILGDNGITLFEESDRIIFEWAEKPVYSVAWKTNSQGLYFMTDDEVYLISTNQPKVQLVFECHPGECHESGSISLIPGIQLSSLTNLRAQPPSIERQTQGTSVWSKTEFKDLLEPGTNEYSRIIPAYSTWRWDFSWCAKSPEGLAAILDPLDIEFFIGGEQIGEDAFRMYDSAKGGGFCRTWATLLSGWQPGDNTNLEIHYTLREAADDGTREYPAGEYRQIINLKVT